MANPWLAWAHGTDPAQLSRALRRAHEVFVGEGHASAAVRPVVLDSWQRARTSGLDPYRTAPPIDVTANAARDQHPLAAVRPLIDRLLVQSASDAGHVVALSDAGGTLLWVDGDAALRRRVGDMGFVEGARWSEDAVGTNAPGTALRLDHSLQIFSHEHFSTSVQPWSCSAAPIHDPRTGALLGALDLTGGDAVASPHALSLVEATVAAVEAHLLLVPAAATEPATDWHLTVMGATVPQLRTPHGTLSLTQRHAEILLVMAMHPDGLGAESLAEELHTGRLSPVTVRAEMTRLRRVMGDVVASKPYALTVPLSTDVDELLTDLRRGAVRKAADRYTGPVLPASDAPAVQRLRDQLTAELRRALLRHGSAEPLLRYADTAEGRADAEVLEAAIRALPYGSPRRPHLLVLLDEARRPDR